MATQRDKLPGGILIPQLFDGDLEPIGTGGSSTTDSSYTQAGPRPGQAIVDDALTIARVEVSGAQGVDMEVTTARAGSPGTGVEFAVRQAGAGTNKWRGWDGVTLLSSWVPVTYLTTPTALLYHDEATVPSTQETLVATRDEDNGMDLHRFSTTLGKEIIGSATDGTYWNAPAIVVLPESERILVFFSGDAYYTDGSGTTLSEWSTNIVEEDTSTFGRTRAALYRNSIIMLVQDTGTPGTVHHYASLDLGASFQLVATYVGLGLDVEVKATPYGLVVCWLEGTTRPAAPQSRVLASAWEEVTIQDPIEVSASTFDYLTMSVDQGGTVYVTVPTANLTRVYSSKDRGGTWGLWKAALVTFGHTTDRLVNFGSTFAMGRLMVVCKGSATTNVNNGLCMLIGGGYSTATVPGPVADATQRITWGLYQTAQTEGATWVPIELPQNSGWTAFGAGTEVIQTPGELLTTTTAGQTRGYYVVPAAAGQTTIGQVQVKNGLGGSSSTMEVGCRLILADGVYDYEARILIHATGYEVVDSNGATSISVTRDTTTDYFQLRWAMALGAIKVWDRDIGEAVWNFAGIQTLTDDSGAPSATNEILFGHLVASAATSKWREMHYHASYSTAAQQPSITQGANVVGKPWTAHPEPIPDMGSGTAVAWMAMTAGPARSGDTWTVDARYDYGISHLDPVKSPSPAQTWRSTDTAQQSIVYDLGASRWIGNSLALVAINANFRKVYLDVWNGSSWVQQAELDLADGFTDLAYDLEGDSVVVNTATTSTPDRFLWEEELLGAWAHLDVGASVTASHRVSMQSAGSWTGETTVHPVVSFTATPALAQGTLDADGATRTLDLVHRSGFVVIHPAAIVRKRYIRIRIPAGVAKGPETPLDEDYYEAGALLVCRVQPFGVVPGWAYSDDLVPSLDVTVDAAGTRHALERGTPARTFSAPLVDASHLVEIRAGTDLEYVGGTSGVPLAVYNDVGQLVQGLFRSTNSGALPVVYVESIPKATDTIVTDPTLWLYGHMTGTARVDNMSGDLGIDEVSRVATLTFKELV